MFRRAIEILDSSSSVKVFAPSGVWAISREKDLWIEALSKSKADRYFLAGGASHEKYRSIVARRLAHLESSGVKVRKIEPQADFGLGFIIFDSNVLLGLGVASPTRLRFVSLTDPKDIKDVNSWFDNIWRKHS